MKSISTIILYVTMIFVGISCSSPKKTELKVISYNVRLNTGSDGENRWDNRKHASVNMINDEKPTIFGLQEAKPEQVRYLAENLPQYGHIGVGRDDGKSKGEHMSIFYLKNAIELLDGGTFWLSETPEKPSMGWDADCIRTCTWTKLKVKQTGKEFIYLNTHLDHVGYEAKLKGLALIVERAKEIASEDMPVFLTADFNAITSSPIFESVKGYLLDGREEAPETDRRATINFYQPGNEDKPEWVIDHVFFRGAEAKYFKVLRDKNYGAPYISDHYPVVLQVEF